jgi:hypothetical protein
MKISLRDLTDAQNSLMKVLAHDMEDIKLGYRLSRLADKFMSEMRHVSKSLDAKRKELGAIDPATGRAKVKPENMQIFLEQSDILLDEEIEINVSLIPLYLLEKELENPKAAFKLSPVDWAFLNKFIDHGAVEEPKKEEKSK